MVENDYDSPIHAFSILDTGATMEERVVKCPGDVNLLKLNLKDNGMSTNVYLNKCSGNEAHVGKRTRESVSNISIMFAYSAISNISITVTFLMFWNV